MDYYMVGIIDSIKYHLHFVIGLFLGQRYFTVFYFDWNFYCFPNLCNILDSKNIIFIREYIDIHFAENLYF